MSRRHIRRFCACIATTAFAVAGAALPADAAVANPGPVDIHASVQVQSEEHLAAEPISLPAPLQSAVGADGTFVVPQQQFVTNPVDVEMEARGSSLDGDTVHFSVQATSDLRGTVTPENQTLDLSGTFVLVMSIDNKFTNCPVGPFTTSPRSSEVGGRPYGTNGDAILVDRTFTIPELSPLNLQLSCVGWEGSLNRALDLPSSPGEWTLTLSLVLVPAPSATTTTTTVSTPTTQPTTQPTASSPDTTAPSTSGGGSVTAAPRAAAPRPAGAGAGAGAGAARAGATTTVASTTSTSTVPPLRDLRPVVPPLTGESQTSSTTAPTPAAGTVEVRIPDSAQPVSNSVPSGVLLFAVALLLGGIGITLIGAELRKTRSVPKRSLN